MTAAAVSINKTIMRRLLCAALLYSNAFFAPAALAADYYVSRSAGQSSNNGQGWATAFKSIDQAIKAVVKTAGTHNIYIEGGDYAIGYDYAADDQTANRDPYKFGAGVHVNIFGGYAPMDQLNAANTCGGQPIRNPLRYTTRLATVRTSGVFVFDGSSTGASLHIDGLTYEELTESKAEWSDLGTFVDMQNNCTNASLSLHNFIANGYSSSGTLAYGLIRANDTKGCTISIDRCVAQNGKGPFVTVGAGVAVNDNQNCTLSVTNSIFNGNGKTTSTSNVSRGIINATNRASNKNVTATVSGCTFAGNVPYPGTGNTYGSVNLEHCDNAAITDCTFANDSAHWGAAVYSAYTNLSVSQCRFIANTADKAGGAVYIDKGTTATTFDGCQFYQNGAPYGAAYAFDGDNGQHAIRNCEFGSNNVTGNVLNRGGAVFIGDFSGTGELDELTNCKFYDNAITSMVRGEGVDTDGDGTVDSYPYDLVRDTQQPRTDLYFYRFTDLTAAGVTTATGNQMQFDINATNYPTYGTNLGYKAITSTASNTKIATPLAIPSVDIPATESLFVPVVDFSSEDNTACSYNDLRGTIMQIGSNAGAPGFTFTYNYRLYTQQPGQERQLVEQGSGLTLQTDLLAFADAKGRIYNGESLAGLPSPQQYVENGLYAIYEVEVTSVADSQGRTTAYDCAAPPTGRLTIKPEGDPFIISSVGDNISSLSTELVSGHVGVIPIMRGDSYNVFNFFKQIGSATGMAAKYLPESGRHVELSLNSSSGDNGLDFDPATGLITMTNVPEHEGVTSSTYWIEVLVRETASDSACRAEYKLMVNMRATKANYWVGGQSSDYDTPANWSAGRVPAATEDIVFANGANAGAGVTAQRDLLLPARALTHRRLSNQTAFKTVIPAGGVLNITDEVEGCDTEAGKERILIKADPGNALPGGSLIIGHAMAKDMRVYATVEFHPVGKYIAGYTAEDKDPTSPDSGKMMASYGEFQYFGVPVDSVAKFPAYKGNYIREYSEPKNDEAHYYAKWLETGRTQQLKAFRGYATVANAGNIINSVGGRLVLGDVALPMTRMASPVSGTGHTAAQKAANPDITRYGLGENLFANSFAAALDIDKIVFPVEAHPAVYLYTSGAWGDWQAHDGKDNIGGAAKGGYQCVTPAAAGQGGLPAAIPSMQGFMVKFEDAETRYSETPSTITFPYAGGVSANTEPLRAKGVGLGSADGLITATLSSGGVCDKAWLFSRSGATAGYDRGMDGLKAGLSAPAVFVPTGDGDMQINFSDGFGGLSLGFAAVAGEECTLRLDVESGDASALKLLDMEERRSVGFVGGSLSYRFTPGVSGPVADRFVLVESEGGSFEEIAGVPTGLSSAQAASPFGVFDTSGKQVAVFPAPQPVEILRRLLPRGVYVVKAYGGAARKVAL